MGGCAYIMASGPYGTLYVGVTHDVGLRAYQHREDGGRQSAFCKRYGVDKLVWYEWFDDIRDAIHREKRLKRWPRRWKIKLIERENPTWRDLYLDFPEAHPLGVPGSPIWEILWASQEQAEKPLGSPGSPPLGPTGG